MTGFTDIHSHFVYGIDDGAQTAEEMYAMLDQAYENGISRLYATPHMVPGMTEFNMLLFRAHLQQARTYCQIRQYPLELLSGAEILYTPQMVWYAENHKLPVLEGSQYVLVEFSPEISFKDIREALELLRKNGYRSIIAHTERYDCLLRPRALKKLKSEYGVRFQVNANTVCRKLPLLRRLCINRWFADGMIDFVASDAHNTQSRPFHMREAYEMLSKRYTKKYAKKLVKGFRRDPLF